LWLLLGLREGCRNGSLLLMLCLRARRCGRHWVVESILQIGAGQCDAAAQRRRLFSMGAWVVDEGYLRHWK
jgi:hypothetical protein